MAFPSSPTHMALFIPQENLLPRGIPVFWGTLQPDRGAGCQRRHHGAQTQRQHPGEIPGWVIPALWGSEFLIWLFLDGPPFESFQSCESSPVPQLGRNGMVGSVSGGGTVTVPPDPLYFWALLLPYPIQASVWSPRFSFSQGSSSGSHSSV